MYFELVYFSSIWGILIFLVNIFWMKLFLCQNTFYVKFTIHIISTTWLYLLHISFCCILCSVLCCKCIKLFSYDKCCNRRVLMFIGVVCPSITGKSVYKYYRYQGNVTLWTLTDHLPHWWSPCCFSQWIMGFSDILQLRCQCQCVGKLNDFNWHSHYILVRDLLYWLRNCQLLMFSME